jgi:pilus assembly protein CpaE
MNQEKLNISIIYGTGVEFPPLPELLNKLPQVNIAGQSRDITKFLRHPPGEAPDSVVVYLNGLQAPPEWLAEVARKFPQAPVLVCSEKQELDFLKRAMQLGVREFLSLPLSQAEVQAAVERVQLSKSSQTNAASGMVVGVTGHKGGVGATTIAINLAVALAEQPGRCALVDLGRPFPDIGNFLDQDTTYDLSDVIHHFDSLDQSFIQKIVQPYGNNLEILHGISDFKEQDNLHSEGLGKLFTILRGLYKYVVVDLGHLFDEVFFRVFREADLVLMLTELNVPNFRNLRKLWPMLKDWDPTREKVKVVVNRHSKGNELGMRELEKILGEPPLAILPSDYAPLILAINQGVPLAKVGRRSKLYVSLKDLAQKIIRFQAGKEDSTEGPPARRRFWIF